MSYDQETYTIKALDHGYVRLVEDWGRGDADQAEAAIIEAARQSTQGSFRGWGEDSKLLAYLFNNHHATPFEFAGMTIEVQAPLMVFREWHRHRTQSYNEMSARYAPMPDVHYVPTIKRLMMTSSANKQAGAVKGSDTLSQERALKFQRMLMDQQTQSQFIYEEALKYGVPKELARGSVTVFRYSRMRATANLRNWLAFMTLRCDPAAQWEIQQFAGAVAAIVMKQFPQTFGLWQKKFHGG